MDLSLLQNALMLSLESALPFIIAALIAALFAGILRAALQIEDEVVTFAGKLTAVALVVWLLGVKILEQVATFTEHVWGSPDFYF